MVSAEISDSPETLSPRPSRSKPPRRGLRFSDSLEAPRRGPLAEASEDIPILRLARGRLGTIPATTALTELLCLDITSNQSTQPLRQTHDDTVQRSGRLDVSRVNTLPSAMGRSRGYRPLCCLTPAPRTTRRGESGLGSCNLGISGPTAPSRPRPLDRASDSLIVLRLARDPR